MYLQGLALCVDGHLAGDLEREGEKTPTRNIEKILKPGICELSL
jgi:hypothetical protein